jgi:hypothetical protein
MELIGWQITFDLRGRLPIARSPAEWDRATRTLLRVLARWALVAFCVVHDHLHVIVACDRAKAGRAAQAVEVALGWWRRSAGTPRRETWNPPRFTPVRDRRHLGDAARYVLANGSVETGMDILTWRWSNAWEILGLRPMRYSLASGFEATTPAFVAEVVAGRHDWRPEPIEPCAAPSDSPVAIARIAAAVLGYGSGPEAMDRTTRRQWRELAIALGRHRGWTARDLASALGIRPRTADRIRREPAPDALAAATRLLGLLGEAALDALLPLLPPNPLPPAARRPRRTSEWITRAARGAAARGR